MDIGERKRGDRQRLARMIARESNAVQRDRLRSVLLVLQGRQVSRQGTLTAVWAIKGSRPPVVCQHGRKSIGVFAADEQALVEEAMRSHRTLRRNDIRSICRPPVDHA